MSSAAILPTDTTRASKLGSSAASLRTPAATPELATRIGRQFEQLFLSQMLTPMFEGISANGPFGGGKGEEMFRSFQVDAYAQAISRRGGIGIAQNVAREILRLQETRNG